MLIQSLYRGRTFKEVRFLDARNDSDFILVDAALTHARETPSSIFGREVIRYPCGSAVVVLHTD